MLALIPIRRGERWALWTSLAMLIVLLVPRIVTDPRCLVVLDPHQHGCHTFMIAVVLGVVGLALARRLWPYTRNDSRYKQERAFRIYGSIFSNPVQSQYITQPAPTSINFIGIVDFTKATFRGLAVSLTGSSLSVNGGAPIALPNLVDTSGAGGIRITNPVQETSSSS